MDLGGSRPEIRPFAEGKLLLSRQDGVAHICFNHPEKRNAMSLEMGDGFLQAMEVVRDDPTCRVLVLSGEGGKAFVSGADISQFEKQRTTPEQRESYARRAGAWRSLLVAFPLPTIAAIRGYCLGGGLGLALSADIRLASTNSQFGIPAAKLGIAYAQEGLERLVQNVGPSWARLLMYSGMRIDAEQASRIGLITQVVPDDELEATTFSIARQIAANAPLSVAASRITIAELLKDPAARDLGAITDIAQRCGTSADALEGRRAFIEKRPPKFTGS